ncbi:MAG: hypothetical protein ACO1SV_21995 [Fimbriimonas sp.]
MIKKKNIHGLFAAAAAMGILAGCGGGGNPTIVSPTVPLSGGISTEPKTDTPSVPATNTDEGNPTTYTTTVGGVMKTVYIAATSTAVPAGTPIAVFPDGVPIVNASFTRAPGDIYMTCFGQNGARDVTTRYSNIVTASNGNLVLTRPIGLTPGQYYGSVEGPLYFSANGGQTLTLGSMGFMFEVKGDGACSFPTLITGALPANGGHTGASGISVTANSPATFAGGATSLLVGMANGQQIVTGGFLDANGKFTFRSTQGGFPVPSTGIESIQFSAYGPVE